MQRISTPDLCDMAEEKGIQTHILQPGLLRSYGGIQNFYGVIETCRVPDDNSRVKELLQTPGNGRVLVVDGGGEMRCALLGDLIAESAHKNGWAGVIINGCVRDVDEVGGTPLGVQAIASIPRKSKRRGLGEASVVVSFGGVTFTPGEWVYADLNGVLVSKEQIIGEAGKA
eukprot:jgi/Mesvir1/5254/Mv15372-RA.1